MGIGRVVTQVRTGTLEDGHMFRWGTLDQALEGRSQGILLPLTLVRKAEGWGLLRNPTNEVWDTGGNQ
jgi:hypothetical protein